jgi:hypothetical protein
MFADWIASNRTQMLAERVAGRSRLAVWQRVASRLPEMGPTEGRGYLRARAISIVREETRRLIAEEGRTAAMLAQQIEASALAMLIESLSARMTQPRSHTVRRRAA